MWTRRLVKCVPVVFVFSVLGFAISASGATPFAAPAVNVVVTYTESGSGLGQESGTDGVQTNIVDGDPSSEYAIWKRSYRFGGPASAGLNATVVETFSREFVERLQLHMRLAAKADSSSECGYSVRFYDGTVPDPIPVVTEHWGNCKEFVDVNKEIPVARYLTKIEVTTAVNGSEDAGLISDVDVQIRFKDILPIFVAEPTCASLDATLGIGSGNVAWRSIKYPGYINWTLIRPEATGKMFVAVEATEKAPMEDYDVLIYQGGQCGAPEGLRAISENAVAGKPIGERILLNVEYDEDYRLRVAGRTSNDFYNDGTYAGYFEAISYGNFNRLLVQGQPQVISLEPAAPGAPAGVLTARVPFKNISSYSLTNLTFEIVSITGGNVVLNTHGPKTGDGNALIAVSNIDLPPYHYDDVVKVPLLEAGEWFDVIFRVGLRTRTMFSLYTDVYATSIKDGNFVNPADAASDDSGPSFVIEFGEADLQQSSRLYLPVIQQ